MKKELNYFTVYERRELGCRYAPVYSDGTRIGEDEQVVFNHDITGYTVEEYTEQGRVYREYEVTESDTPEILLQKIRDEHDPNEWQNDEW